MPSQELEDFAIYWRESMINPDTGEYRPAGGFEHEVDGVHGVDYSKQLIPWCKGNSVSVDQTTLQLYRNFISRLVENFRIRWRWVDAKPKSNQIDSRAGLTVNDIRELYGKLQARGTSRVAVGQFSDDWFHAEYLFNHLLRAEHINLYSEGNTLSGEQDRIINEFSNAQDRNEWMRIGICNELKKTVDAGGHIRLNGEFGWQTYIRDHYGAPGGMGGGIVAGSLQDGVPPNHEKTMPLPLHIALSETLARAHSRGLGTEISEWGKNQSRIRREIADKAIDEGDGSGLPLDDYYAIFARNGAPHMADSFFHRWVSDRSSARYELEEVIDSEPKKWMVLLEPDFIRWRILRRERERERHE